MSLALVQIPLSDFDTIYDHLVTFKARYRNMHLRQMCVLGGQQRLRYLQALVAHPRERVIEGKISGPGLYWHFKLRPTATGVQMTVLAQHADARERRRILRRFLPELLARVHQERSGTTHFPKLKPGRFYLRRRRPGITAAHPNCRSAVTQGELDSRFVASLQAWNFALLNP